MLKFVEMVVMRMVKFLFLFLLLSTAWAETFLPVDEAFVLTVHRDADELTVQFDITQDYYLYRDRYFVQGKDGAELSAPEFSSNVEIKYDPNFDEDMAVFHNYMDVVHRVVDDQGYVQIVYQGCADAGLCYPPQKRLFTLDGTPIITASVGATNGAATVSTFEAPPAQYSPDSGSPLSVVSALLFALMGGLVLNLMPCVFPVLSLKAMHMASFKQDVQTVRRQGIAYTAGVIVSFVVIASLLSMLRYFGHWVGWGFQLQSPLFVSALVLLFFVMSLMMSGYIEFGKNLMGIGQGLTEKPGVTGAFFTGTLATVVATPCTAPFMGAAIGVALLQPMGVSLLIFAALGLGLALPILAISFFPSFTQWIPAPGLWMVRFRQLLTFPLIATTLWLLWVLVEIKGADSLLKVGLGLILMSLGLWSAFSVVPGQSTAQQWFKRLSRGALVLIALFLIFNPSDKAPLWQDYSAQLVADSLANDQPVFIDVTAAWCITCKVNERIALSGRSFEALVDEKNVVLIKADWTVQSPPVDALIAQFNRDGVPLYIYYASDGSEPIVLPQVLTSGLIASVFSQ